MRRTLASALALAALLAPRAALAQALPPPLAPQPPQPTAPLPLNFCLMAAATTVLVFSS